MASRGVSMTGRAGPALVGPAAKVDSEFRQNRIPAGRLLPQIPLIVAENGVGEWVSQQDNAPSCKSAQVLAHLRRNAPMLLTQRPANTPDCAPRDFFLWGAAQRSYEKGALKTELEGRAR